MSEVVSCIAPAGIGPVLAAESRPRSGFWRGARISRRASAVLFTVVVLAVAAEPAGAQLYIDQQFGVSVTSDIIYTTGAVQFPFSFDTRSGWGIL